ncbi:MAG TPA: NTP transferase domain-containing protein [Streptosporangiaceae bacterium]
MSTGAFDAIVLAGGRARRAGRIDKPGLRVGGRTLVASVVTAAVAAGAARVIVAGPDRPGLAAAAPAGGLVFVREDPPGSGPVAALRVAMAQARAPVVALLAGDLPFLTARQLTPLLAALAGGGAGDSAGNGVGESAGGGVEAGAGGGVGERAGTGVAGGVTGRGAGVVLLDDTGRPQWLASCWRTAVLAGALAGYQGYSLRELLAPLRPSWLACPRDPGAPPPWLDCDTPAELAQARRLTGERAGLAGGVPGGPAGGDVSGCA